MVVICGKTWNEEKSHLCSFLRSLLLSSPVLLHLCQLHTLDLVSNRKFLSSLSFPRWTLHSCLYPWKWWLNRWGNQFGAFQLHHAVHMHTNRYWKAPVLIVKGDKNVNDSGSPRVCLPLHRTFVSFVLLSLLLPLCFSKQMSCTLWLQIQFFLLIFFSVTRRPRSAEVIYLSQSVIRG